MCIRDSAEAQPGELNFASSGSGQALHLSGELFKTMAGIHIVHISYKGSAPARTDLLAGQVQMMFESLIGVIPFITQRKLRALAVSGAQRSEAAPDISTMSEAGVSGFEASAWVGILAPAGTPRPIIGRLNADIVKVMQMQDVKTLLARNGPEQFAGFIKVQLAKWSKVVKASGAKLE